MNFHRGFLLRSLVVGGLAVAMAGGAEAALITTTGEAFTDVGISLLMGMETDAGAGTTTLSYEITLGEDATAQWQIVGFAVIRQWAEGAYHSTGSADGWSVTAFDDFVNWKVHTDGSEVNEGTTLPGFTYTYFGDAPTGQFYRYLVSKDGGTPFQLLSTDVGTLPPAVVVPEPTAATLLAIPLAAVLYRRRA